MEKELLSQEIAIPIYFAIETDYLIEVYTKLSSSVDKDSSATAGNGTYLLVLLLSVCLACYCIYISILKFIYPSFYYSSIHPIHLSI